MMEHTIEIREYFSLKHGGILKYGPRSEPMTMTVIDQFVVPSSHIEFVEKGIPCARIEFDDWCRESFAGHYEFETVKKPSNNIPGRDFTFVLIYIDLLEDQVLYKLKWL